MVHIVRERRGSGTSYNLDFLIDIDDTVETVRNPFTGENVEYGRLIGIEYEAKDGVRRKVMVRTVNMKDGRTEDEDLVRVGDVRTSREVFHPRAVRMSARNLKYGVSIDR